MRVSNTTKIVQGKGASLKKRRKKVNGKKRLPSIEALKTVGISGGQIGGGCREGNLLLLSEYME